jgi:hypothetical protein
LLKKLVFMQEKETRPPGSMLKLTFADGAQAGVTATTAETVTPGGMETASCVVGPIMWWMQMGSTPTALMP